MARKAKKTFDPKIFLATVNHGRTASTYPGDAFVYQQARPADAVFYIRKGRIKIVVASQQGKEAVVAVLGAGEFFGEGCGWRRPGRWSKAKSCGWVRPR